MEDNKSAQGGMLKKLGFLARQKLKIFERLKNLALKLL